MMSDTGNILFNCRCMGHCQVLLDEVEQNIVICQSRSIICRILQYTDKIEFTHTLTKGDTQLLSNDRYQWVYMIYFLTISSVQTL